MNEWGAIKNDALLSLQLSLLMTPPTNERMILAPIFYYKSLKSEYFKTLLWNR